MRKNKSISRIIARSIPMLLAFVVFILTIIFKHHPQITERIYSQGIYPVIASILSFISFYIPFSISDSFYIILLLCPVVLIILTIARKLAFTTLLLRVVQIVCVLYSLFYILWGFNYYRLPVKNRMNLKEQVANEDSFISVFNKVVKCTNAAYVDYSTFNPDSCYKSIEETYCKLSDYLNINYSKKQRRVKHITFSKFFAQGAILGYYGPFFSEVHINSYLSPWDIPVTTAHEKAHQFGITGEGEANFYACMCCLHSKDKYVKYSGWLFILDYFIYEIQDIHNGKSLLKNIDKRVVKDIITQHKYWNKLRNAKIDKITSKVNDAYLKTNSVEKGIDDYNAIVQLMVDLYYSDKNDMFFN